MFDGNTTPSWRTRTIGRRLVFCESGGRHPSTSAHRTSTYGDGSEPKNTVTGSALEKFSPYTVSIFDACGLGFIIPRATEWCFGASDARSGGRYLTTPGKGVTGLFGIGNEPVGGAPWLSNSTGGT